MRGEPCRNRGRFVRRAVEVVVYTRKGRRPGADYILRALSDGTTEVLSTVLLWSRHIREMTPMVYTPGVELVVAIQSIYRRTRGIHLVTRCAIRRRLLRNRPNPESGT